MQVSASELFNLYRLSSCVNDVAFLPMKRIMLVKRRGWRELAVPVVIRRRSSIAANMMRPQRSYGCPRALQPRPPRAGGRRLASSRRHLSAPGRSTPRPGRRGAADRREKLASPRTCSRAQMTGIASAETGTLIGTSSQTSGLRHQVSFIVARNCAPQS